MQYAQRAFRIGTISSAVYNIIADLARCAGCGGQWFGRRLLAQSTAVLF